MQIVIPFSFLQKYLYIKEKVLSWLQGGSKKNIELWTPPTTRLAINPLWDKSPILVSGRLGGLETKPITFSEIL